MQTAVHLARGLELKNPVMNASGTFAYGEEFAELFDLERLGGILTKGLSLAPKVGNPTPRVVEASSGLINSIGLENIGVEAFVRDKLPLLARYETPVIVNFFGASVEDYVQTARRLDEAAIAALEMNVSCPNVRQGGIEFGRDPDILAALIARVRAVTNKPLIVKLSPLVTDLGRMALAAQEAGADALTCINTIPAMAIDEERRCPVLGNITGGLSGPAIKPIALRMVYEVYRAVSIPIIASGGISTAADVIQFLLAGATAVQIGSASLREPLCFTPIIEGVRTYLTRHAIEDLNLLIGAAHLS